MEKEIFWESQDGSVKIRLVFISGVAKKFYHVGKSWTNQTQCLLYFNGFLRTFSTVVKHKVDEHNQDFAYRLAATKALKEVRMKETRKEIFELVEKEIESGILHTPVLMGSENKN